MDLYNNQKGIDFYLSYKKKNKHAALEIHKTEKEALNQLRTRKLKVIKSRFKKIPRGYYSEEMH